MRVLRILALLIAVAGLAAVGTSYFFGSLRVQRDASAYVAALQSCTPFEQEAWAPILWMSQRRSVDGVQDGRCVASMDTLGAGRIRCALDEADRAVMIEYVRDSAETVTFLGGQTAILSYSSENPDPLTRLMNGPACALEN